MACDIDYQEDIENLQRLLNKNGLVQNLNLNLIDDNICVICTAGTSGGDNYMSVVKRVQIKQKPNNNNTKFSSLVNSSTEEEENATTIWTEEAQDKITVAETTTTTTTTNDCCCREISLIIKRQIPSLSRRQLYRCDEAFNNEINAYKHIVPLLEQYSVKRLDEDPYFPKCYYAGHDDSGEIIVLEDLKQLGFRMQNRLHGLELSYCELVMKQLAKLHAASIAAKQLNHESFHEKRKHIKEIVYCEEAEEFYGNILEASIQESLISLRNSNVDGCLTEPIRLIEKLQRKLFRKIQSCITNSKESLNVVCHGDLWVNNIMFIQKANENNQEASSNGGLKTTDNKEILSIQLKPQPCDVRFFDLQAMRYTSPVFDILHFIYTSTKRDLRDTHTRRLLETYCCALANNLEVHFRNYESKLHKIMDTFSLSNITEEYYDHLFYGLAISMWILPAVTFDPNDIPNLDAISEMVTSAKEIKCTQKLTPEYHSRLKDVALEFYQNGYFNSVYFNDDDDE